MPRGMRSWHAHAGKWIAATSGHAEREERQEICRNELTIARKSDGRDGERDAVVGRKERRCPHAFKFDQQME